LLSGVCERFPAIKMAWSEAGIGWIPSVLERCDRQVDRHQYWGGRSELKPSELFARNMWACMVEEPLGLQLWELIGEDKILAETDYPHADTPFPHVQKAYDELFEGIPERVAQKVSHGNAESLFGWKMAEASLATIDQQWSPPPDWSYQSFGASDVGGLLGSAAGCPKMVTKGALIEQCGAEVTDGVCAAGHKL
jgi:hypothetical protein